LIAVVLSGRLDGGARGAREVKHKGGRVIVEDPRIAVAPDMPKAALATGCVDFVLSPERIGDALQAMCSSPGAAELFRVRMNPAVAG
jgi:two-component system chemotaxis response regulator CheB